MKPIRFKTANVLLWTLCGLLLCDVLYLSYFWVFRADYYFPDRYERAYAAAVPALGIGLALIFLFPLIWSLRSRARERERLAREGYPRV
jgi:hypothetical protein